MTVAAVAGDELFRRGVAGLLRSVPEVTTVHECGDPEHLGSLLSQVRVEVVVASVAAGPWLERVREPLAHLDAAVVIVADHAEPAVANTLGELSIRLPNRLSVLWQPTLTGDGLREALRQCRRGQVTMPPDLVRALLAGSTTAAPRALPRPVNLTRREREALALLVRGLSNKQIAGRLGISSHGAKRLVTSIMLKLDAPNRTMAAVTAIRAGIVDPPAHRPASGS